MTKCKHATSLEQQISILKKRNVEFRDENKAKEILLDIGYYRLGFYFFPFEKSYPALSHRDHIMEEGTNFLDAVTLYYFDFDLRMILTRFLNRIEVAFRTYSTYYLCNKYVDDPFWFVSHSVVSRDFANSFEDKCYKTISQNEAIRRHHRKHKSEKFAPAWKTMEFMTMGNMIALYKNLVSLDDKLNIAHHFGINQTKIFENYLEVTRQIRNICAHGAVLYDCKLYYRIQQGPAGRLKQVENNRFGGALKVIAFLLGQISNNRLHDMVIELNHAYMTCVHKSPKLKLKIESASQMKWELPYISELLK